MLSHIFCLLFFVKNILMQFLILLRFLATRPRSFAFTNLASAVLRCPITKIGELVCAQQKNSRDGMLSLEKLIILSFLLKSPVGKINGTCDIILNKILSFKCPQFFIFYNCVITIFL